MGDAKKGMPFAWASAALRRRTLGKRRLGGRPYQGRQPPEAGAVGPAFTEGATQPYSTSEVDGWLPLICFVAMFCMESHRRQPRILHRLFSRGRDDGPQAREDLSAVELRPIEIDRVKITEAGRATLEG